MGSQRAFQTLAWAVLGVVLGGCSLSGEVEVTSEAGPTATILASPTAPTLAPTLPPATPTVEANLAPTALPPPTEIVPPTAAPNQTSAPGDPLAGGPSLLINPALGEPGEVIIASGSGFAPSELVQFHWNAADLKAPTGPVYFETNADANGMFSVGLIVPPADKWPGGPPVERGLIQLRVTAPSLGFNWLFHNFTYVKRFNPATVAPTATLTETPTP